MSRILKLAIFTVLTAIVSFNAYTEIKKPISRWDRTTDKYGYKSDYGSEWLIPPTFDRADDFGKNDYAMVEKDGKYNLVNLNLTPILPEWGTEQLQIHEGFIVLKTSNCYKIYDMNGHMRLKAKEIRPLLVYKNSYSDQPQTKHWLGFSVKLDYYSPYYFYDLTLRRITNHSSVSHISSKGGLLLFTEDSINGSDGYWFTNTGGIVTDAMCNEIEHINGYTEIMGLGNYNKVKEMAELEQLYDGYLPCYLLEATGNYKAKGRGVFAGHEIVKKFGFKHSVDIEEKKKAKAKKFFRKPEIVALYKEKVLTPLEERLKINQALVADVQQQPQILECTVIKYGSGYALSSDGLTPIISNNKVYDSLEPIGNRGLLLGIVGNKIELVTPTGGNIVAKQEHWVDISELDKEKKYLTALRTDGKLELLDASGFAVGSNIYDEIIPTKTSIGEIFYVVSGTDWGVWAPGYKDVSPKVKKYHYIGLPDSQGVVEVRYNGFPGTYNVKTSEEVSPTKTLFNKAYNNTTATDAIGMYLQVIELDKVTKEGYTGVSLNNIGTIYEDAGDEDTAYDYYERSMNAGNKTGEQNYKRIRNNRRLERIANIAGAIANVSASAVNIMSGGANVPVTQYNSGYGDLSSFQSNSSSSGGYSTSFYQEQYNNWERRAQGAYESLTNLGSRTKRNGSEVSGSTGQSMSSSNYTRQKKCLRDAQNEMRTIRQKARKDGVNIAQSHWETVTVSY